jgi:hypothetical protein
VESGERKEERGAEGRKRKRDSSEKLRVPSTL